MVHLGLVGCGCVAKSICVYLNSIEVDYDLVVFDRHPEKMEEICSISNKEIKSVYSVEDMMKEPLDFLIEAASRNFAREYGAEFLKNGTNLITLSNGFLVDDNIRNYFIQCAEIGNSKIYLPGGPPGTDAASLLQIYGIKNAKYTSLRNSKHPFAKKVGAGKYFTGSVREAMTVFDKTLNTSAVLAEATLGYNGTQAEVGFYDEIDGYELKIDVNSDIAQLNVSLKGKLDGVSGKYVAFAALSVVNLIKKLHSRIVVGM